MELRGGVILATTLIVLLFGGLVTTVTVRAARRTRATALWSLAIAIALITVGTVVAELMIFAVSEQAYGIDIAACLFLATGFTVLAYSIYGGYS